MFIFFVRYLQYSSSKLKALAILNQICPHLTHPVGRLPHSDANFFSEYILPIVNSVKAIFHIYSSLF